MASIHKLSSVTPLSELECFTVPSTQNSIARDILAEHRPISAIDSKSPLEFIFSTPNHLYPRLDKTRIRIRVRIQIERPLKAEVKKEDWDKVSLNNNTGGFFFKMVDFTIGDRIITPPHQTYGYTVDIETKLGKSKDIKNTLLANSFWKEDITGKPDDLIPEFSKLIRCDDETDCGRGKEFEIYVPISLSMFQQTKALIGGCNMRLRLFPNDPAAFIKMSNDVRLKSLEITDACLFMHYSYVSPFVVEAHLKALEISNAKYPIREAFTVPITIPKGTQDHIIDQLHNGQLPNRAVLMMVKHSAFIGSHTLSANNYHHFNLNYAAFFLNGIQYPEIPFTPNFKKGLYSREYSSLFEATNQDNTDTCITLKKEEYPNGNAIFAVNFSPDLSTGCCGAGYVNPINFGTLRLHLKFDKPLDETITALVYLDYDTILEINKERNPITSLI